MTSVGPAAGRKAGRQAVARGRQGQGVSQANSCLIGQALKALPSSPSPGWWARCASKKPGLSAQGPAESAMLTVSVDEPGLRQGIPHMADQLARQRLACKGGWTAGSAGSDISVGFKPLQPPPILPLLATAGRCPACHGMHCTRAPTGKARHSFISHLLTHAPIRACKTASHHPPPVMMNRMLSQGCPCRASRYSAARVGTVRNQETRWRRRKAAM